MSVRHAPWAEGPADFAIGLRPIPASAWLEGGPANFARKEALLEAEPASVWGETAGSRIAQTAVLALVESAVGAMGASEAPPLWAAGRLVEDDLCLMEKRDGAWRLTAASLCSPTFFTVEEALGKSLAELHGPVPAFGERFLKRIERIFDGLGGEIVLERRNWTVVNSQALFLPRSAPLRVAALDIRPSEAGEALFVRVERQTLRRLSREAVLFTIRVWRHPLADLLAEPERLLAFARAWRSATADFRAYKGLAHYDRLVENFLSGAGFPAAGEGSAAGFAPRQN